MLEQGNPSFRFSQGEVKHMKKHRPTICGTYSSVFHNRQQTSDRVSYLMGAIPMSWLFLPPMLVTFGSHVKTFLPCAWQSRMLSLVQCSEYTNAIREQEPGLLRLHDRTTSSQRF
jgi:hypothetical protein